MFFGRVEFGLAALLLSTLHGAMLLLQGRHARSQNTAIMLQFVEAGRVHAHFQSILNPTIIMYDKVVVNGVVSLLQVILAGCNHLL